MNKKVVVVGGGAAGMMAAIQAAKAGAAVVLLEKMKRTGKKMLITGKGRCNITNSAELRELIKNMTGNGSFLYSAIAAFSNDSVREFFAELGVPTKVERGGRVFPESDKAADVVGAMMRAMHRLAIEIAVDTTVSAVISENGQVTGVKTNTGALYSADAVIIATGGASYPGTGSTGDGYKLAEQLGHTIIDLQPSLVPLEVEEEWLKEVQGLSLRNVKVTALANNKVIAEEFGEMLFTHFGVSGPIILSLSRAIVKALADDAIVDLVINLKPALSPEQLNKRIQRDFEKFLRKQVKNSLGELLPAKLINPIIDRAYLDPEKPIHQVTREERLRLAEVITHLTLSVTKARPLTEAIVTAGGISTKEINPKTMESKLIHGLYFAGEVIDVDGYTGGYNLQAAFSSGYAAGTYAGNA